MKIFLNHASGDKEFVSRVRDALNPHFEDVYCFEYKQRADESYVQTIDEALDTCESMIVFVRGTPSPWQVDEAKRALEHSKQMKRYFFVVELPGKRSNWPEPLAQLNKYPNWTVKDTSDANARSIARKVLTTLQRDRLSSDGLPRNAQIFRYEKDIIDYYLTDRIGTKLLDGCPESWPDTQYLFQLSGDDKNDNKRRMQIEDVGIYRAHDALVVAAALTKYHTPCLIQRKLCFREAGPRERLFFPQRSRDELNVAILVSGGIAPGINAVIDAIVQRHYFYADPQKYADRERYKDTSHYRVNICGVKNGFQAFKADGANAFAHKLLDPSLTSESANKGGSMLGTSRVDSLISGKDRIGELEHIVDRLQGIDILYVIGGDGSMKAAHSIWSIAESRRRSRSRQYPLSVVAIPKTMDNDILWMWQSFGFMSAVEKGREVIDQLSTEIRSNPRLCVVQLYGSDSGFVVSHAVMASESGQCDAALVPEAKFSMEGLARYLRTRMCQRNERIPHAMVVMAETAIPTDALNYIDMDYIGLTLDEKKAIREFDALRKAGGEIQGQTKFRDKPVMSCDTLG